MYRIATEGGKWVSDNEKYVEYTPVKVEKVEEDIFYRVVVGSFTTRQEAEDRIAKLKAKKVDSFIMIFEKDDITYYRVVAGSYGERKNADDAVANLAKLGFESFLVAFTK
nr:SPOR domain-containing protein [Priestia megaterium]